MDQETFTNHIVNLSQAQFDIACKIVLQDIFHIKAANVDASGDGGSDFAAFDSSGSRIRTAYQVTTQKTQLLQKGTADAKKAVENLKAQKFLFFTTVDIRGTKAVKLEKDIEAAAGIPTTVYGAGTIAGLLIDEGLLNKFLDEAGYPLPRGLAARPDFREMALHGLTVSSEDSRALRASAYDDAILFAASTAALAMAELVEKVIILFGYPPDRADPIAKRIGALFAKELLAKNTDGKIILSEKAKKDVVAREQVYTRELDDLSSVQTDLMHKEFGSRWTVHHSKDAALLIAHIYISSQTSIMQELRPSVALMPIFRIKDQTIDTLKSFLLKNGLVKPGEETKAARKLLELSSNHPLITKLVRASVYVSLEGRSALSVAKSLGAGRWTDYSVLIEPSVAIPFICDSLFRGERSEDFAQSIRAVQRAKDLGTHVAMTYFYVNECAGHLLRARHYAGLKLNAEELRFSPNAFVANYHWMRKQGARVPEDFLEYLKIFSPAVATPRAPIKDWVRAIMTDIQSIITRNGIGYLESPHYTHAQCADFEKAYAFHLKKNGRNKPKHLIDHDVWALQVTQDRMVEKSEHWLILTYDRSMIEVGAEGVYKGWVTQPAHFLDLSEIYQPLSDAHYSNLIFKVASFSERTLSAGARILDKIIAYASREMQNWEFAREVEQFKQETLSKVDLSSSDAFAQVDAITDGFLADKGLKPKDPVDDEMVDVSV